MNGILCVVTVTRLAYFSISIAHTLVRNEFRQTFAITRKMWPLLQVSIWCEIQPATMWSQALVCIQFSHLYHSRGVFSNAWQCANERTNEHTHVYANLIINCLFSAVWFEWVWWRDNEENEKQRNVMKPSDFWPPQIFIVFQSWPKKANVHETNQRPKNI